MRDCNQCGKCCIKYGGGDLAVTKQEIELWELFNPEIFAYVKGTEIWFDPESGEKLNRCPFLQTEAKSDGKLNDKYTCSIYLNRPQDCRYYPSTISEMIRDDCEMLEPNDIKNPDAAQRKLDLLMIDSRPGRSS